MVPGRERGEASQKFNEDEQVLWYGVVPITACRAPASRPRSGWAGGCKLAAATLSRQGAGEMMGDTLQQPRLVVWIGSGSGRLPDPILVCCILSISQSLNRNLALSLSPPPLPCLPPFPLRPRPCLSQAALDEMKWKPETVRPKWAPGFASVLMSENGSSIKSPTMRTRPTSYPVYHRPVCVCVCMWF